MMVDDCSDSTELGFTNTFQQVGKFTTMRSRRGKKMKILSMLLQVDLKVTSFVFSLKNYGLKKYKNMFF